MNDDMIELDVRIVKQKASKGAWAVYEVEVLKRSDWDENAFNPIEVVQMTGEFEQRFYEGEEYIVYGTDGQHRNFGYQFKASVVQNKFDTPNNLKTFLLTMVAPSIADQLISKYGDSLIDKIVNKEVNTDEIYGMGAKRFESLYQKVTENRYLKDLIVSLSQYGITPNQMKQIATKFKGNAIERIKDNPYCLCEIRGISFKKADEIAKRMNFDMQSMFRISEGIKYVIEESQKSGHSWIKKDKVISDCVELMEVSRDKIRDGLAFGKDLYVDEKRVSLEKVYNAECDIAEILKKIQSEKIVLDFDVDKFIEEQEKKRGIKLTEQQKQLFYNVKEHRVNFLVGFGGTGKSFLQGILMDLLDAMGFNPLLLAPTGRASAVLSSYVGRKAYTIHKSIRVFGNSYEPETMVYNEFLVVDELSMVDSILMQKLLKALANPRVRVLFCGDPAQIPSIGVGSVLYDCTNKSSFPTVFLTQVFRQSDDGILDVATKIRTGKKFVDDSFSGEMKIGNDFVLNSTKQDYIADGLMFYFKKAMSKYNIDDIAIVTPSNKGKIGTLAINNKIQEIVNGQDGFKKEVQFGKFVTFREGDRVIHTRNMYEVDDLSKRNKNDEYESVDVFNGDIGRIETIDAVQQKVIVQYQHCKIAIPFQMLEVIKHGWALTVHKCITDDTWIYTDKGLMQIKQLNNGADEGCFKEITSDIKVFNGEYMEKPKSFYNSGESETRIITTKRGYSLNATLDHRLDVLNTDGEVVCKFIKDITKDDYLLIRKGANIFNNETSLPDYIYTRGKLDVRAIRYDLPQEMTIDFAMFLGYMVADGTVCQDGLRFSKQHEDVSLDFCRVCKNIFNYNKSPHYRKYGDYMVEINSTDIRDFCRKIDGLQPNNKFVPEIILKSPMEYQCAFLSALFEDGSVNVKNGKFDHVELSMKNEKLCDQVRMMLLNMGIATTKSEWTRLGHLMYHIYIYKNDAKIFRQHIGFISKFKQDRLKLVDKEIRSKSSKITFPYVTNIISKIIKDYEIYLQYRDRVMHAIRRGFITDDTINYFLENYCENINNDNRVEYLRKLVNNYFCEKIKDIKESKAQTFCLEMPKTHKFIQNGISGWNCQGSSFDCVISVVDRSHTFQMNCNLLYTAVTRSKKMHYMLCQANVINSAMKKVESQARNTFLPELL